MVRLLVEGADGVAGLGAADGAIEMMKCSVQSQVSGTAVSSFWMYRKHEGRGESESSAQYVHLG